MAAINRSSNNIIELDALRNGITGDYINDATVTVTIVDPDDNELTGQSWPTTMDYVNGSNGKYRALLDFDIDWPADYAFSLISVNGGAGLVGYFKTQLTISGADD